jgi:hypothetical protein
MANPLTNRAKALKRVQQAINERFGIEDWCPLTELALVAAEPTANPEMRMDANRFLLPYFYEDYPDAPLLTVTITIEVG